MTAAARTGCWLVFRGGGWEYIASLHPRPSVHGEEPHPTGGEPVYAEHSGSTGVNLEKQSPILRYKHRAYRINGSGCLSRTTRSGIVGDLADVASLTRHGGSAWRT